MKRSFDPTEYVIVRTGTKSVWDRCHFALLHLTQAWLYIMRQRLTVVAPFKHDPSFYNHTYWDEPLGYYVSKPDTEVNLILRQLEADGDSWAYLSIEDPDELVLLDVPECRLDTHLLMINADGGASYLCYGKQTDEEYLTEGFSLKRIVEKA